MKRPVAIILGIFIFPNLPNTGSEMVTSKATPKEVYEKVAEAANYLALYGEGGVKELQNPDGRFVVIRSRRVIVKPQEMIVRSTGTT